MNIFDRAIQVKTNNIHNVAFLDKPFKTKDLYINNVVLLSFTIGQEIYFFVIKSKNVDLKNRILSSIELQDSIQQDEKVLAIDLKSLKPNQFIDEQKLIHNFMRQVGEKNVSKV